MPLPPEPISAMTPATGFAVTDVFPILQSGANAKCTRGTFLAALAGESISITSAGTNFNMLSTGNAEFDVAAGANLIVAIGGTGTSYQLGFGGGFLASIDATAQWEVDHGSGAVWLLDAGGNFQIAAAGGGFVYLLAGGSQIFMLDAGGIQFFVDAGQVVVVPYLDGAGVWKIAPPADFNTAIDRLATALAPLVGGVIP